MPTVDFNIDDYYDEIPDHDRKKMYEETFGIPEILDSDHEVYEKLFKLYQRSPLWFDQVMDDVANLESFKKYA